MTTTDTKPQALSIRGKRQPKKAAPISTPRVSAKPWTMPGGVQGTASALSNDLLQDASMTNANR